MAKPMKHDDEEQISSSAEEDRSDAVGSGSGEEGDDDDDDAAAAPTEEEEVEGEGQQMVGWVGEGQQVAKGSMEKSMVADNDSGESLPSEVRTNSSAFLAKRQDEIVSTIEKRVAAWTFLPEENVESMQVLRYEIGQKYDAPFDYFHDKNNIKHGGQRFATVLMYLTDVKKGGETVFPNAEGSHLQYKDETWSECSRSGLAAKPKKGDALLFFDLHLNATMDTSSLHGNCPVIEGEKWSATKWIHQ